MIHNEKSKKVVEKLHREVFINGNMDAVDEVVSPDYVGHHVNGDFGREKEFGQHLASFHNAFPDLEFKFKETIAQGDLVASRFTFSGTHEGEFKGMPPTGKRIQVDGQIFHRVQDGMVVESWPLRNDLGMMQQLGMIEMPQAQPA